MIHYAEHIEDVLAAWLEQHCEGGAALVAITLTEGGGVRAPGAVMTVSQTGQRVGYISGGCLDADVARHALDALTVGKARKLRYGSGSPFVDLPLPCGGAIEVLIVPKADPMVVRRCADLLSARIPLRLGFRECGEIMLAPMADVDHVFTYLPKLRIRIAGRSADAIALHRVATAAGLSVLLQMPEQEFHNADPALDLSMGLRMQIPTSLPVVDDDPWTAVILSLHDADWEDPLLVQALEGRAHFIGAVGSRKTHDRRCNRLRARGVGEEQIRRIRGPVGLVASMRDASFLAVSILAEILSGWKQVSIDPFQTRP
ncbi:XdhC family protein [Rhizobium laguerreae]|uniref:XdhC family protein n=1 Tax=Rhizobium laguerreae TaxID=1076926 RepID=UPI001C929BB6|nr:XdhC family protein [Rhizobium laguerreae]MBY3157693.1 XdhC family protein [Rhizobium laguerreae]